MPDFQSELNSLAQEMEAICQLLEMFRHAKELMEQLPDRQAEESLTKTD